MLFLSTPPRKHLWSLQLLDFAPSSQNAPFFGGPRRWALWEMQMLNSNIWGARWGLCRLFNPLLLQRGKEKGPANCPGWPGGL